MCSGPCGLQAVFLSPLGHPEPLPVPRLAGRRLSWPLTSLVLLSASPGHLVFSSRVTPFIAPTGSCMLEHEDTGPVTGRGGCTWTMWRDTKPAGPCL